MTRSPHFIHNTDIGQNFLIDRSIVEFMIDRAKLGPEDRVLEIGPGEGILTKGLLSTECSGVCTIELDTRLRHAINMIAIRDDRLRPLWGDAVQFDYEKELPWMPNRVIANLPYHITTPLLWVFLEKLVSRGLDYMLLMVQLESAQRIISSEGHRERSPLGITIEAMGSAAILRNVPSSAFRPRPRVNSCIIEIRLDKDKTLASDRTWRELLAKSFAQRRKTLVNNWTSGYTGIDRRKALDIIERHGLKTTARAEELSLETWRSLSREAEFYLELKNGGAGE